MSLRHARTSGAWTSRTGIAHAAFRDAGRLGNRLASGTRLAGGGPLLASPPGRERIQDRLGTTYRTDIGDFLARFAPAVSDAANLARCFAARFRRAQPFHAPWSRNRLLDRERTQPGKSPMLCYPHRPR